MSANVSGGDIRKNNDLVANMYRDEYEKLKIQVQELLMDMEYHHQTDDDDTFHKWWREDGREAEYYSKREQLDRLSFLAASETGDDISGAGGSQEPTVKGKGKIFYRNL